MADAFERIIPARTGFGFQIDKGDRVKITDLEGAQPVDFWAFNKDDFYEFLSCQHTKPSIEKLYPGIGDSAYTNKRRPIVTVIQDTAGQHDMQFAACDPTRYRELGFEGEHASCQENLHQTLSSVGHEWPFTPQPWNLFTNFFINADGTFSVKSPETKSGDYIILEANMPSYIVLSACPQDQNLTCGGNPTDVMVSVL